MATTRNWFIRSGVLLDISATRPLDWLIVRAHSAVTASAERVVVVDTIAPAAPTVTTSFAGRDASFHVDTKLEATLQCRLDSGQWE